MTSQTVARLASPQSAHTISTGVTIAVLWIGSTLVVDKSITPGTLMLFYSLIGYVISPISSLISANPTIQDALIAADRLFQIMDLNMGDEQLCTYAVEPWMIEGGIIFDEATSSLDSISERYVKKTLDMLAKQGKTIIMIAHRLSTIKNADHIFVLDKGKVAESGTHQSLLSQGGIYSRLWHEQFDEIE